MVTVDQIKIADIHSKYVPYVLPVCEVHRTLTRVTDVKRFPDEKQRILQVMRMCRCEECYKNGVGDIAVINSRSFR